MLVSLNSRARRSPARHLRLLLLAGMTLGWSAARAQSDPAGMPAPSVAPAPLSEDQRPLSAAQLALFETPHLQNVRQPATLRYELTRAGEQGFTDRIAVHVRAVHDDGTRDVSFDFLSGAHHVAYPELDGFRGNPLLMLVLERDVLEMKATLGLSAAYFRNCIRRSFVDRAELAETQISYQGRTLPARRVTVRPFAGNERLGRLPTVQRKSYVFVLAEGVPGGLAELRVAMPADPGAGQPAFLETIVFAGVQP